MLFCILYLSFLFLCSCVLVTVTEPWTFWTSVIRVSTLFLNSLDPCLLSCRFSWKLFLFPSNFVEVFPTISFFLRHPWSRLLTVRLNLSNFRLQISQVDPRVLSMIATLAQMNMEKFGSNFWSTISLFGISQPHRDFFLKLRRTFHRNKPNTRLNSPLTVF